MTHTRKISHTHSGRCTAAILATTLLFCQAPFSVAQAGQTEQVIFSAENALYGAGYDIGRADGWFDNDLRGAVRAYQKANALTVSGKLDNATLSALGIKATSVQTVSGNALSSRAQSLKALELPSPATMPVARPEARKTVVEKTVARKPVVETTVVEEAVVEETVVEKATVADVEKEKISESTNSVQAAENLSAKVSEKQIAKAETSTQSEEEVRKPVAEQSNEVTPATVASSETTTAAPVEQPQAAVEPARGVEHSQPDPAKPEEKVAVAEPSEKQAPAEPRRASSGGGFFTALFDFFFGWLV
ncbi:Putative peptidoglycan binding domain-containing protein [Marinobacter gudaonensis]|uniref:Putative peptidoglycan binding domain-containing protein n=1 Tax=Marinobacter gudaonensis TaxID=375760 RepID=A0A1I6G9W9_9GAMM|nr:peptidoglycan-binding domain-containing protein [Marinobacter gudaonensis]SFR38950.1 Putative peptidoglycan binding domain-containing protein [Marinobacter gudaonensis]